MVITFDNSDNAVQAFELLRVSHYEDKKLLGKNPYNVPGARASSWVPDVRC
jgi:hypothetical protein